MKYFKTRIYSIQDFLEWHELYQLVHKPHVQGIRFWTHEEKSYLIDTILEGKPIPKVYIRQTIHPVLKTSIKEILDGRERLSAILGYLEDGFVVSPHHNKRYGGVYFSQLNNVDDTIQVQFLKYQITVDLLCDMTDDEVVDIFRRLNSQPGKKS
jgi:uncharacterized protein with ParB-like and HNH nuclease domain